MIPVSGYTASASRLLAHAFHHCCGEKEDAGLLGISSPCCATRHQMLSGPPTKKRSTCESSHSSLTVRMEHGANEGDTGRLVGIVLRKNQLQLEGPCKSPWQQLSEQPHMGL